MSTETKIFAAIIGVTILIVGGASLLLGRSNGSVSSATTTGTVDMATLIRDNSQSVGPKDAKVNIVEFSDFECSACKQAEPVVEEVLKKYNSKIQFIYREFPLPAHVNGMTAAKGAEGAGLQNKFWEMHNKLFEKSPDLSKEVIFQIAKDLGLDMDKFTKDFDSEAVANKISADQIDGNKVGLEVTPTFFINGTKFNGGLSLDQFSKEIETRLK